jgi:hypothetical protein
MDTTSPPGRLTPIHLYKLTPRTNCGDCGFATCLAYATQVVVGAAALDACPHLDPAASAPFRAQLAAQHGAGIGLAREGFDAAFTFLRGELAKWDFEQLAGALGAELARVDGHPALRLPYLGQLVTVTADDVIAAPGAALDPWEKILLCNYVIGGAVEPAGRWVGMEGLPNSISKAKSLKAHCEDRLANAFGGTMHALPPAIGGLGAALSLAEERVDFAAEFTVLPRLPVRVLWWDEDRAEGFGATAKFLFDARVLDVLDLESLLFACEQLTERLLEAAGRGRSRG